MNAPPTSATAAKDRLYGQLSASLGRLNRSITRTADLLEDLQNDLHAMSMFAGLDAAKSVLTRYMFPRNSETLQVHGHRVRTESGRRSRRRRDGRCFQVKARLLLHFPVHAVIMRPAAVHLPDEPDLKLRAYRFVFHIYEIQACVKPRPSHVQ